MSLIILRIIRVLTNVLNRAELQVNKSINIGNVARWRSQLAKKSRYVRSIVCVSSALAKRKSYLAEREKWRVE